MIRPTKLFPLLALAGLTVIFAACSQMATMESLPASHPEELGTGRVSCSECHEDTQKGSMKPLTAFNHSSEFVKNHRFYAATDDKVCATCHKPSFCADCHTHKVEMKPSVKYGNRPDREMPHRGDFMTLHKIEGKLDPASCYRCHGRANNQRCVVCHTR
ncbi:cytochrome C [Geoanaerobacter pelophilus]|uniref:Cytochrome C n=1 Tax=Geoanaerobacter pelophilus TaxID=60036 RepID=A0ABQ0MK20_9BACT|nr:cytochrome C [Geoanaerobacter pelophilus]GAW67431.1 cytochrome C [Geoanaerobacter pelophilus]